MVSSKRRAARAIRRVVIVEARLARCLKEAPGQVAGPPFLEPSVKKHEKKVSESLLQAASFKNDTFLLGILNTYLREHKSGLQYHFGLPHPSPVPRHRKNAIEKP